MKNISIPYFLIAAIAAILWLPSLLAKGMFMDGMYNAILAQNLAHGISTFWAPQTNDYSNPAYWNNPPLSMFTLGSFYKVFGDSYMIDKIYSLTSAVIQLFLLTWTWRIFWSNDVEIKKYSWLPCLLWLISPLTSWCYSNNLMENTMSIFTTLSLISFLLFVRDKRNLLLFSFSGAGFVFLACLTKGPTGLFPLVIPVFFIWSINEFSRKQIFGYIILQGLFFALLFLFLFSMPAAENFLHQYFTLRLAPAMDQNAKAETERYIVFKEGLIMILPFWVMYFGMFFIPAKRKVSSERAMPALSFILCGLAASLPIAFSMVQRKFYLLPSLPVFVLGFSILLIPLAKFIEQWFENFVNDKISATAKWVSLFVIFISILFCIANRGSFVRDKEMLTDIESMLPLTGNEEAICADWQLYGEWSLRAYCTRYYNKKMYMPDRISETKFYMTKPGLRGDKLAQDALKIYTGNTFDLYKL